MRETCISNDVTQYFMNYERNSFVLFQVLALCFSFSLCHAEKPQGTRSESSRQAKLLSYITVETEQNLVPNSAPGSIDMILSKLETLQKTTVTKKQIAEIKRLVDKGLEGRMFYSFLNDKKNT